MIFILHGVTLVLSFYVLRSHLLLFLGAEGLILVSGVLSWQLYRQMLRPLQTVVDGIEAIKDKDFNVKFLRTGTYEMDQLIGVYNEMMDHLRTERTRQEQQHFFLEKLIQTSPTGILILDFDGRIYQVNPKACAVLGMPEAALLKQPVEGIGHPLLQAIAALDPGAGKTLSFDGVHTYKLQRAQFMDRGFARSFVMIEELTAEILAAEKKAYGKVIRMMAHEVNNTIGPVNSIIESAIKAKDLWTPKQEALYGALQVAFDRNRNLNGFMRNFADVVRLPPPQKSGVDLGRLIGHVTTLFAWKAEEARIRFEVTGTPFTVQADGQQLEQALINIVKNAMEAIGTDGRITLATEADRRRLTITDTGRGISKEQAEHLFSPFFSTKRDGQGVGLTLVKEILLNHGFAFSLKTVEEGRTVFQVDFGEAVFI
ncbi:MAG TPA: ATP-binding protein [Chitinophagaceae bacterium]|nr:ATP-binding protein [Chitinophagaceae bacterium]